MQSAGTIYYDVGCSMETDFLKKELLPDWPIVNIDSKSDIQILPNFNTSTNLLVFSSNKFSLSQIQNLCQVLKPKIIFHCSDEFGYKPEYDSLADQCSLYLRQYHHVRYPDLGNKVSIMPLGYGPGLYDDSVLFRTHKISSERTNNWAFVGTLKRDREVMLQTFRNMPKGYDGLMDSRDMANLYDDTVFVPIGRGNTSLNCFRIYEAISCGAIPILVSSSEELYNTFKDEGDHSWLVFSSWKEALEKCNSLLQNPIQLNIIQALNLEWWRLRLESLQLKIQKNLFELY
jgi:hypothetical protein